MSEFHLYLQQFCILFLLWKIYDWLKLGWTVNFPYKGPVIREEFPCNDDLMV